MDTLYHYCSVAAFHSIVSDGSLWLSSLSMSNDRDEGRLASGALRRLAASDRLSADQVDRIQREFQQIEEAYDGLGLCLSQAGDQLSQWRGYGRDGRGLSIGLNRAYLMHLAESQTEAHFRHLSLDRVVYEPEEHENRLRDL